MGTVKEAGMSASEHGLFGYSSGERTITLSASDGSARFGRTGAGQIIIDPSTGEALLTSGNYDEKAGTGMEINLSKPSIRFGSGKFGVNANGEVFADGFATTEYVDAEIQNVAGSVETLEQSIPVFDIQLTGTSITVPCNADHIPLDNDTYSLSYTAFYKGIELEDNYNVSARALQNSSGIIVDISTLGTISITTLPNIAITNIINDFILTFKYHSSDNKDYIITKQISVTLAVQGKDGVIGKDGDPGKSAYQIWLDAGNTGSEQDYLNSLKGQDGQPGEQGKDGAQGKSAYQIWLDAGNTGTEEQYLASLKGEDGQPGEQGKDGNSITAIKEQYYLSTSNQSLQGGAWSDTQALPTEENPYLWIRTVSTLSNGTTTESTPTLAVALNEMKLSADAANAIAQDALANVEGAIDKATSAETAANKASSDASSALSKANEATSGLTSLSSIVSQNYEELQGQIDGAISTWFYGYDPNTANTLPTSAWTTEALKNQHLGDLFYIIDDKEKAGQCFRYAKVDDMYKWVLVEDAEVTKAIATATQAQRTADGKATIYTTSSTPIGAQEGDLWIKSKNDGILTYVKGKWEEYNKYTDNTVANEALTKVNTAVSEVNVQYYLSTENNKLSGGSWKNDAPTWVNGKFMWSRTKVVLKDGTTTYQPSENGTCIAGATGATGATGGTGPQGVGVSSITELYYLSNSTSAPSKPTAHVTSTSTSNGVWTTKCPT